MEINFSLLKKIKRKFLNQKRTIKKKQTNKQTNIADKKKYIFGHFHYEPDISLLVSTVPSGLLAKFLSDFKYILNIFK